MDGRLPISALINEIVAQGLIKPEHAVHMQKIFVGKTNVGQVQRLSDEDWRRIDLPSGLKSSIRQIAGPLSSSFSLHSSS